MITTLLLTALLQVSGSQLAFEGFLTNAADVLGVNTPALVVTKDPLPHEAKGEMATFKIPNIVGDGERYVTHIREDFLANASGTVLRHAARHEVCHIKLGHIPVTEDGLEGPTEACILLNFGEKDFLEAYRALLGPMAWGVTDEDFLIELKTSMGLIEEEE